MVADKRVIIGSQSSKTGVLTFKYATGVKESPDISEDTVQTFDGAVVQGMTDVSYELEIEKLRYEGMNMHMKVHQKIESMMENPEPITVIDTVRPKGEQPYEVIKRYKGCITTGNDYEIKPDEHTAESLKFKCASRTQEWKLL